MERQKRNTKEKGSQTKWCVTKCKYKGKKYSQVETMKRQTHYGQSVTCQTNINLVKYICRYQLYVPVVDDVVLRLCVKNTSVTPFSLLSPGKLEIEYIKSSRTKYSEIAMTLGLTSSDCNETMTGFFAKNWKETAIIVGALTYTDDKWKFQKKFVSCHMKIGDNLLQFDHKIGFQLTITEFNKTPDIRYNSLPSLSSEESEFIIQRKKAVVAHTYKDFCTTITSNEVPITAIIGSGGGMRAVIGMGAALDQLKKSQTLDYAIYVAGLSGSSWYLMSLYANDDDFKPKQVNDHIRIALNRFAGFKYWIAWLVWKYFSTFHHGKFFSMTNPFGEMIGHILLTKTCKDKWSQQTNRLDTGKVPLPLISALQCRHYETTEAHNEWIEFSPYQVFIPRYGIAINMQHFGDRFYRGYRIETNEEPPVYFLQGVCGSAYAKGRDFKPSDKKWYMSGRIVKNLIWSLFKRFDSMFVGKVPNFLHGMQLSRQSLLDQESETDAYTDFDNQEMLLVDAGLAFNSPYPSVLHPCRKVELIFSFDFSDRGTDTSWPFEELERAQKWAQQRCVPFPELKLEAIRKDWNKGIYKKLYVFEGYDDAPTIVHIVMLKTCHTELGDVLQKYDILSEYKTLRFNYSAEDYDKFSAMVKETISENRHDIHDRIERLIVKKMDIVQNRKVAV